MEAMNLPLLAGDAFGFFFVIIVIGAVIAAIAFSSHRAKVVRQNWIMFGQKHKLNQQGSPTSPMIQGWFGNTYITLNTQVRGSGKNRTTYTQHHAAINAPMPMGLEMYKEGFFSSIGKIVGTQDIQVGDAAVDAAFMIKGNDTTGIKTLLTLPEVKKALIYTLARHPGMRISHQNILVEATGMTGDIARLETIFNDITYLAQSLDAGYQEIVARHGGAAPSARPVKSNSNRTRALPATASAAAAEILSRSPQVRTAGPEEDPAQRAAVFGQMANALHQYEDKLERGDVRPEARSVDMSNAFDDPHLDDDIGAAPALDSFDPKQAVENLGNTHDAFDNPDAGNAFDNPVPFEVKTAAPTGAGVGGSLSEILDKLTVSSFMSSDRDEIIKSNTGRSFEFELVVDRVDKTFGFDVPENLRDGRTIEAQLKGGDGKLEVRLPKGRNAEIDALRSGATLKVRGTLAAWDDLFKKAKFDVV